MSYKNYPDRELGPQYRDWRDTPDLYVVVRDHFLRKPDTGHDDHVPVAYSRLALAADF